MKRVFARISLILEISDEEHEALLKKAGIYNGESNELDINMELAKRFVKDGELDDSSYIPMGSLYSEM